MEILDEWLTIDEVAKILKISSRTIRRRMRDPNNPMVFTNFGTQHMPRWRITRVQLRKYTQSLDDPRFNV